MPRDASQRQDSLANEGPIFKPGPRSLFVASVIIIFVAEAIVMLFIGFFDLPNALAVGIVDASLLSLFVAPTLYLLFFKPMRETIDKLDKSELIQSQLKEVDELKSEFISVAAHELCAPVSTITGYTELLLSGVAPGQEKKYLQTILGRTEALARIIDDLQVVNNIETGENLQIDLDEHDIVETIQHVVNIYQTRFPDKTINLKVPDAPLVLDFDQVRVTQVMDNLLSNAIKYENDINDQIDVSISESCGHVEIVVKDEGIGMTPDEVKMIFNKFFRAQTEKSLIGGLGLGMAIVKNIVDGHSGKIDIVSQRKVGTTVTVTLPKNLEPKV